MRGAPLCDVAEGCPAWLNVRKTAYPLNDGILKVRHRLNPHIEPVIDDGVDRKWQDACCCTAKTMEKGIYLTAALRNGVREND